MFNKKFYLLLLMCFAENALQAIFPINLFRTFDVNLKPEKWECGCYEVSAFTEIALSINGRNPCNEKVNVLQIWNRTQDSLAMLRGFDPDSEIGQLDALLNMANDDGTRGHFRVTGDLDAASLCFNFAYHLPANLSFNLFVPIYWMRLKNVNWCNLTKEITFDDFLVRSKLTDNFFENVRKLGDGLELGRGWDRIGFGDILASIEWDKNFPQQKPILKNVRLGVRGGISIPTGLQAKENELFSIPFGGEGAWGVFAGGNIDLTWGSHLRGGVDIELYQLFGNSKDFRFKTDYNQTDLLFLAKDKAILEWGLDQSYNLYAEAFNIFDGLSFRGAYQFIRESDSKISVQTNEFSSSIASDAESLEEWTIHQLIFVLSYDFKERWGDDAKYLPYVAAFYKYPFNGKRAVLAETIGLSFSIRF